MNMTRFAIRLTSEIPNGIKTFSKDYKIKQTQLAQAFNKPIMIALLVL